MDARNSRDVSHNRDGAGTPETGKPPIGTAKMTVVKNNDASKGKNASKSMDASKCRKDSKSRNPSKS